MTQDWQAAANSLTAAATTLTKAFTSSPAAQSGTYQQKSAQAGQAAGAPAASVGSTSVQQQEQQQAAGSGSSQLPKNVLLDLAPGTSVGLASQDGHPKLSAEAPGSGFVVAQVRMLISTCWCAWSTLD